MKDENLLEVIETTLKREEAKLDTIEKGQNQHPKYHQGADLIPSKKDDTAFSHYDHLPRSKEEFIRFAQLIKSQGLLPSSMDTEAKVIVALQAAHSLGFKDFGSMSLAIKNMYFVNNTVQLFGDLPLTLVRRSGKLKALDEFFIDSEYNRISVENKNLDNKPLACVVIMQRMNEEDDREFVITRKDLLQAGVKEDGDGFFFGRSGTWKKYPRIHWIRRTRAWALKSMFSDLLTNSEIAEYAQTFESDNSHNEAEKVLNLLSTNEKEIEQAKKNLKSRV